MNIEMGKIQKELQRLKEEREKIERERETDHESAVKYFIGCMLGFDATDKKNIQELHRDLRDGKSICKPEKICMCDGPSKCEITNKKDVICRKLLYHYLCELIDAFQCNQYEEKSLFP